MGSHKDGAMSLSARHAGNPMRTVMTMAAKLKPVGDFAAFLLSQFAAEGALISSGAERLALRNIDIKGFDSIFLF